MLPVLATPRKSSFSQACMTCCSSEGFRAGIPSMKAGVLSALEPPGLRRSHVEFARRGKPCHGNSSRPSQLQCNAELCVVQSVLLRRFVFIERGTAGRAKFACCCCQTCIVSGEKAQEELKEARQWAETSGLKTGLRKRFGSGGSGVCVVHCTAAVVAAWLSALS